MTGGLFSRGSRGVCICSSTYDSCILFQSFGSLVNVFVFVVNVLCLPVVLHFARLDQSEIV